jgi:dihydrofolate synthase/folylpolyglutamate synthase
VLDFLNRLQFFGIKLGLEQVSELFESCGNPQRHLNFIHLAGTNGKGSVGAMLCKCLREAGFKTGFYSSPHLISVRERFRVNGRAISEERLEQLIGSLRPQAEKMEAEGRCPTYFELTTVIAAKYFYDEKVDFVIWETGMGGRFDATNVVDPLCSVITGIGMDHQAYLGDTPEKIALEKAGIIKPGKPVFCACLEPAIREVIKAQADKVNAPIHFANLSEISQVKLNRELLGQDFEIKEHHLSLSLPGEAQRRNALLAFEILEFLAAENRFDLKNSLKGFSQVKWPGRMQLVPGFGIIDGAHNPQGTAALLEFLDNYYPDQKFRLVFANFADKNTVEILKILERKVYEIIFLPVSGNRNRKSCTGEELEKMVREFSDVPCRSAQNFHDVLENTDQSSQKNDFLLCGSLFLAGEALKELLPEDIVINI